MEINNSISFYGHDVFLVPNKDTYLLYAPILKKLLNITEQLALKTSDIGLSNETDDLNIRAVVSLLEQSLNDAIKPFLEHFRERFFCTKENINMTTLYLSSQNPPQSTLRA